MTRLLREAQPAVIGSLRSCWRRGRPIDRIGYSAGILLLISGLIHLGILLGSAASWEGPLSWRKPATFGVSFGLTLLTIVWVTSLVRLRERTRSILLGAFTAACVLETTLVSLQTWRGVPSHFNVETRVDQLVTRGLAGGGIALVAIVAVLTFASFRANSKVAPSLRLAVQTGFVILCGAMAVGGVMIARGMLLVYGGDAPAAYATGGALKPTHAVTMHAILVLPLLAWFLSFADWSERRRRAVVRVACAGYILLAITVALTNLAGLAPAEMPLAAGAVAGLGILLLVSAGTWAVAGVTRGRHDTCA